MGVGGFPGEVGVVEHLTGGEDVVGHGNPGGSAGSIFLHELARGDVVVTGGTKAVTEFQLVQPVMGSVHPGLVGDGPGHGGGGEEAPAVTAGELGAAIGTERYANGVTVLVVVVHTAEEGQELVVGAVLVVGRTRGAGSHEVPGHLGVVEQGQAIHQTGERIALGNGHFLTQESGELMVGVIKHLGKIVIQGVGVTITRAENFLVLGGRGVLYRGLVGYIVGGEAVETVVGLTVVFQTALNLEAQVLDDGPVEGSIGVPGLTDTLAVVVGYGLERRCVVAIVLLQVGIRSHGAHRDGCIGHGVLETAVTGSGGAVVDTVGTAAAHVDAGVADVHVEAGGLGGLEVALEVQVVTEVLGAHHDGLVAHVGITEGPVVVLAAAADGSVDVERAAGIAEHGVHPVVGGHTAVQVNVGEGAKVRGVVAAEVITDGAQFVLELHEVLRVHSLDGLLVGHGLETVVGIEFHGNLLAFLRALGGHNHNTVRTTGTVDSGGESVLQNVDGSDFRGGDVVDALYRETVHDVQRGAVLGDGTAATHADFDIRIRVAFGGHYGHTGHLTGKGLGHSGNRLFGQFVRTYAGHGAQEVTALHRGITYHHNLIEEGGVGLQDNIDLRLTGNGHRLVGQADEGEYQIHCAFGDREGVVTVNARNGADGGAFHQYTGANERFTGLIGHNTLDGGLCPCGRGEPQAKCERKK